MDDNAQQLQKALSELPNCGLNLTQEQDDALGTGDPNRQEVKAWLKRNGLDNQSRSNPNIVWKRECPHARITVNGVEYLMRVDARDFGTIYVPDNPIEPQQHKTAETKPTSGTGEAKKGWLGRLFR